MMFLQLKPKTLIFMDWVAYLRGQSGFSYPSTKGLHTWFLHNNKHGPLFGERGSVSGLVNINMFT